MHEGGAEALGKDMASEHLGLPPGNHLPDDLGLLRSILAESKGKPSEVAESLLGQRRP